MPLSLLHRTGLSLAVSRRGLLYQGIDCGTTINDSVFATDRPYRQDPSKTHALSD